MKLGALDGVRVLDLSRILAGPTATQLLGDLGADVVKVEQPGKGDDTRTWGPPYVRDGDGLLTGESAYYLCANRNKRSIALDFTDPADRAVLLGLVEATDVLVENHKPGGLARFGLSYEDLRDDFPDLVYCSISGFGQTGPYSDRPGYDFLVQAMGGIMSVTGEPDGTPMKTGVGIADVMAGMYATVGILAALRHRERTGLGQHIDISLLDSQIAWLVNAGTNYLLSGEVPRRLGNGHPNIVPYQVFDTTDAPIILAVGNDAQFARFCETAGLSGLADDPRFATNPARVTHRDELCAIVERRMRERPRAWWLTSLQAADVPCGPVNDLADVFSDPHVEARGARLRMPCPWAEGGEISLLANPLRMSASPPSYRRPPPRLGEDHDDVLGDWLGHHPNGGEPCEN